MRQSGRRSPAGDVVSAGVGKWESHRHSTREALS